METAQPCAQGIAAVEMHAEIRWGSGLYNRCRQLPAQEGEQDGSQVKGHGLCAGHPASALPGARLRVTAQTPRHGAEYTQGYQP